MKERKLTQIRKLKLSRNYYNFKIQKLWIEKYLKLKEGEAVDITVERAKKVKMPKVMIASFRKHFKELKRFSNKRLDLLFSYMRFEKISYDDMNKENAKREKRKFEKRVEKEQGKKFLEDYKLFKKIIYNKEKIKKAAESTKDKELREEYEIGKEIAKSHGIKV